MKDSLPRNIQQTHLLNWQHWKGLSGWGMYFLLKIVLALNGKINFHMLENLVFAVILLLPVARKGPKFFFNAVALVLAIALFWYDLWLPGPQSLIAHLPSITDFSREYIINWLQKLINWKYVIGSILLLYIWSFLSVSTRLSRVMTYIVFSGFISLYVIENLPNSILYASTSSDIGQGLNRANQATDFDTLLDKFYQQESTKQTVFPKVMADHAQPFQIVMISICSLSWADLEAVGLQNSPFWNHFDIVFDQFNSGTSYSGPAALRLVNASCGQLPHDELYSGEYAQCNLFNNLSRLGFQKEIMLDHNGKFDGGVLDTLKRYGNINQPMLSQEGLPVALQAFDGSPIYDDNSLLNRWLNRPSAERSIVYTNLLPLHDGNHFVGSNDEADYRIRTLNLFSALTNFIDNLEKEHRKTMIVIVPEHGANVKGDRIQIKGLRDIPNYALTHVPVAIRFTGMAQQQIDTLHLDQPSSFNAISELIYRVVDGKIFNEPTVNWQMLVKDLPQTAAISENENSRAITLNHQTFFSNNHAKWIEYK